MSFDESTSRRLTQLNFKAFRDPSIYRTSPIEIPPLRPAIIDPLRLHPSCQPNGTKAKRPDQVVSNKNQAGTESQPLPTEQQNHPQIQTNDLLPSQRSHPSWHKLHHSQDQIRKIFQLAFATCRLNSVSPFAEIKTTLLRNADESAKELLQRRWWRSKERMTMRSADLRNAFWGLRINFGSARGPGEKKFWSEKGSFSNGEVSLVIPSECFVMGRLTSHR